MHTLQLVRKNSFPLIHWELRTQSGTLPSFTSYRIVGSVGAFAYEKSSTGVQDSDTLINNTVIGTYNFNPEEIVSRVAHAIPVRYEMIGPDTDFSYWSCEDWVIEVLTVLSDMGMLDPGVVSVLASMKPELSENAQGDALLSRLPPGVASVISKPSPVVLHQAMYARRQGPGAAYRSQATGYRYSSSSTGFDPSAYRDYRGGDGPYGTTYGGGRGW
ncbi:uncharacterized protein L203_106122 [Cryptococcus depauperatus CBS 7841]|uniref:Uncharacterized protein n=1 Tax=Cryptococcus depauperatus CBS 7841 TaxID=1295531 RepID=A0A1E3IVF5_9TREE|nr:hypothetical protein L203_00829 [Cryptococcus depauperatus CBS 7841]